MWDCIDHSERIPRQVRVKGNAEIMAKRTRIFLALFGLLLIGIALIALGYAFIPAEVLRLSAPVAPTLFSLPPGGVP
jgi:hypothetical protein